MGKTMIRIDQNAVVARVMGQWNKALPILTEEILNDCNEYTKVDGGELKQSSYRHTKFEEGVMIWQTSYARRQYWEIRTAYKDENPNATWKWVHVAKKKFTAKWIRQAARLMGARTT